MCIIFNYSKRGNKRTKNAQGNKHNGTCIHLHIPADTCEPYIMLGWAKLSIKYYYIRCNHLGVTTYPRCCNNLPRPWGKLLQFLDFAYYVISQEC